MFSQVDQMILRHGKSCTYKVVTEGVYDPETSSVTNTEEEYTVSLYPRHVKANQFNYPNLIGKDICFFYLSAWNLSFKPTSGDYIEIDSDVYKVESVQKHSALGSVELYKILGVK